MESLLDRPIEQWDLGPEPAYRRKQLCHWIFRRKASRFEEMSSLPLELRARLAERFLFLPLALESRRAAPDGTEKFLWRLSDGQFVESVLIPASDGEDGKRASRWTLCVSTQVGCAYGCRFCASGIEGWKRNLTPGEILAQILLAERVSGLPVSNVVFMGMGEPLANFEALRIALSHMCHPEGLAMGARRITISTSGLVSRIRELAEDPRPFRLAVSLHAPTDALRETLMPVNRRYPLAELLGACALYVERKGPCLTFEYILLDGVNDRREHACQVAELARHVGAKVNLIPYNPVEGLPWRRPNPARVLEFQRILLAKGCRVTVRRPKGDMIDGACGQLRLWRLSGERGLRKPESTVS
jgi:23S rRNA (adenine2503-C2)-methyltransferase